MDLRHDEGISRDIYYEVTTKNYASVREMYADGKINVRSLDLFLNIVRNVERLCAHTLNNETMRIVADTRNLAGILCVRRCEEAWQIFNILCEVYSTAQRKESANICVYNALRYCICVSSLFECSRNVWDEIRMMEDASMPKAQMIERLVKSDPFKRMQILVHDYMDSRNALLAFGTWPRCEDPCMNYTVCNGPYGLERKYEDVIERAICNLYSSKTHREIELRSLLRSLLFA